SASVGSVLTLLHRAFLLRFFFNDTATTEIYTLSLHDALPIFLSGQEGAPGNGRGHQGPAVRLVGTSGPKGTLGPVSRVGRRGSRSEEHTSELQSLTNLVCRLLLEKKKKRQQRCTRHLTRRLTA